MIGDSKEEVGFDISSTTDVMAQIANRAERTIPALKHQQIIRSWGALRVMSPDGYPVYDQSTTHPGAYAVTCHRGNAGGSACHGPCWRHCRWKACR